MSDFLENNIYCTSEHKQYLNEPNHFDLMHYQYYVDNMPKQKVMWS